MRRGALIALCALSACATAPAQSNTWPLVEGCWIDSSDAVPPASMVWTADPDHPGVLMGTWAVNYTNEDADIVTFTLAPSGDGMRLCMREARTIEICTPATLDGERASDGGAIFRVDADTLEFGYANAPAAFFIGRRGGCA